MVNQWKSFGRVVKDENFGKSARRGEGGGGFLKFSHKRFEKIRNYIAISKNGQTQKKGEKIEMRESNTGRNKGRQFSESEKTRTNLYLYAQTAED